MTPEQFEEKRGSCNHLFSFLRQVLSYDIFYCKRCLEYQKVELKSTEEILDEWKKEKAHL